MLRETGRKARSLAGRAARKARRVASPSEPTAPAPALSVVLPVFAVEDYLPACLDSILGQSFEDLEVIVVDDGSPDGSRAITERYAERDPRVRVVEQPNAGLGAARNFGLTFARGEFVAFADSDDIVLPNGYRRMVRTLRESGSEFVVGAFRRGSETKSYVYGWVRRVHHERRLGITVDDQPEVLLDITAWNKVFRRDFLQRLDLGFPVGVRYEDQVPLTRAYLEAHAFDVDTKPVYLWRERDEGTSITQQKATIADLSDRLAALRASRSEVAGHASQAVREYWYTKLLGYDLPGYIEPAAYADDEYWSALAGFLAEIRDSIPPDTWADLPGYQRIMMYLIIQGDRALVRSVLEAYERYDGTWPTERVDGRRRFVRTPELDNTTLPDALLELTQHDLAPSIRVEDVGWTEDGALEVRGIALLANVGDDDGQPELTIHAVSEMSGARVEFETTRELEPYADVLAGRNAEDHLRSGFRARLDPAKVPPNDKAERWRIETEQAWQNLVHPSGLSYVDRNGALGVREARVVGESLVDVVGGTVEGLWVRVTPWWSMLEEATFEDRPGDAASLRLHLRSPVGDPAERLLAIEDGAETDVGEVDAAGRATVPAAVLSPGAEPVLHVRHRSGHVSPIVVPTSMDAMAGADGLPVMVRGSAGRAVLRRRPLALIHDVSSTGEAITVSGICYSDTALPLVLQGNQASVPVGTAEPGPFACTFPVAVDPWGLGAGPVPADNYRFAVDDHATGDVVGSAAMRLRGRSWVTAGPYRWRTGARVGAFTLTAISLSDEDRSLRGRFLALTDAGSGVGGDLRPAVLFECFGGRYAADTPLAITQELVSAGSDLDLVWSVIDPSVRVPDGVRPVLRESREWYELLFRARYLVNNNNFPPFYTKTPGQVYLQTWHGTPLKRIGHDIRDERLLSGQYMRLMDREAEYWDHLISPSPYCTEILPRAFGYSGSVLEVGYPRNDVLARPDAEERGRAVRRRLGIPSDARVLLYAPTWRESHRRNGIPVKALFLDPEDVAARVPDAFVLVRGHANTARSPRVDVASSSRVLDVTLYPDIADLFLAADELITDYSSVMFDFAVLDRPVHLLMPDLADYRDDARGFYFDIESFAPGTIYSDAQDLVVDLASGPAPASPTLAAFRERFCPLDDGHAAARVVAAVWGG